MARFSYGYFGAQTAIPGGINTVSVQFTLPGNVKRAITAMARYDDTLTTPRLTFGSTPGTTLFLFPPRLGPVPRVIYINAQMVPPAGVTMNFPGVTRNLDLGNPVPAGVMPQSPFGPRPAVAPSSAPASILSPAQPSAPAPAATPLVATGKTTVISTPSGPASVSVVTGPVAQPALIAPTPGAAPVVVVPTGTVLTPAPAPVKPAPALPPTPAPAQPAVVPAPAQPPPSNLPVAPTRVQPKAPLLVDSAADAGLPPGVYNEDEYFPPEIFPRRVPVAERTIERARAAMTAAADADFSVTDVFIGGGRTDLEDRPFPVVQPAPTSAAPPSRSGLVPVASATPRTASARPETDGEVLVRVTPAAPPKTIDIGPSAPPAASAQRGGVALLVAGAGGGFLIAGPIGAAVGAAGALLLGKGK